MHEDCQRIGHLGQRVSWKIKASLNTMHSQSAGGNHRSVIFRAGHSITHHSLVVFRHDDSVGHHSDDSVGPFRHDTSVCRSQRGSYSGMSHICSHKAQYSQNRFHRASFMLQNTTRLCQSCDQKLNLYLNAQILPQQISPGHGNLSLLKYASSLVSKNTAETVLTAITKLETVKKHLPRSSNKLKNSWVSYHRNSNKLKFLRAPPTRRLRSPNCTNQLLHLNLRVKAYSGNQCRHKQISASDLSTKAQVLKSYPSVNSNLSSPMLKLSTSISPTNKTSEIANNDASLLAPSSTTQISFDRSQQLKAEQFYVKSETHQPDSTKFSKSEIRKSITPTFLLHNCLILLLLNPSSPASVCNSSTAECILSTADLLYIQISTVHKISIVHQLSTVHFQLTSAHLVEISDINILHLPFFRFWKDPLEDLIYTSCTDPIQQPAAARTPRLYTSPQLCQSLVLRLYISLHNCLILLLLNPSSPASVCNSSTAECILSTADLLYIQIATVHSWSIFPLALQLVDVIFFLSFDQHLLSTSDQLLLLSSTTDQTSHFRMRPVLIPPKRHNEQDSLLRIHSRITVLCSTADSTDVKVADPPVVSTADPEFLLLQLLLLLSSTTDQTSDFRMRPVLFPPKRPNEQDSLLCNLIHLTAAQLLMTSRLLKSSISLDDVTNAKIFNKLG
ncbi:hypothetical protein F511_31794 [Dorcoceras hygrometricum]|uniref:Uncharacterized protein n=1 Tax=Dorcoceras hygrometricum TaxID=472368 RepID=A0A2Z7BZQ0_9LAMI|nr:hypothetical protein F511_31794 [Dorcoceras hygrometricum]